MNRKMKIYTRTGDGGETALFGGGRVPKSHLRVEAYGTVDELNSVLGVALGSVVDDATRDRLALIQHDLFAIGAALATPPPRPNRPRPSTPEIPEQRIPEMESWIDEVAEEVAPLENFILPGGTDGAAELHVARTVCRRAERAAVGLALEDPVPELVIRYLNRLSDLLFALARLENHRGGSPDVRWVPAE